MNPTPELRAWIEATYNVGRIDGDETLKNYVKQAIESGRLSREKLAQLQGITGVDQMNDTATKAGNPTSREAFGGRSADVAASNGGHIEVKSASSMYKSAKTVGKHYRTGEPVLNELGREVELPSEMELAKAGAFLKHTAGRCGLPVSLSEHERELVEECFHKDKWCGHVGGGVWEKGIPGMKVKALLSDSTSGGLEVNPEWFDDALIQFPLLHGELLPFVDLRDVPRGASVEGASIGNPTVTWGTGVDGTSMPLFDTTSLVAEINTSIFPVTCAIEVGRDFLADAAADVGRALVENIGQSLLESLDEQIALGDGTTEPQGIFVASGVTDVGSPAGGAGAAPQIDDYEALMFGVAKQYRRKELNPAFIANDVSYRRARAIEVGASDARRILGLNYGSYEILEHRFAIQNDISNAVQGFGCLKKYRMYRRQGAEIRWETGGKELARRNLALLIMRGRYGGRVVDASAFCKRDDAQA